jgi:signal transduction histidine kinase
MIGRGISLRIALAALAAAAVAIAILAFGVLVIGAQTFTDMMVDTGDTAEHAREMYDQSVTSVALLAGAVAVMASVALAVFVGRRLGRPLAGVASAAQRVALGDYSARVPRDGPDELAGLADSFNQMAADLEAQEQIRRDFIANAAHELRTPLTNLKGYLEALRDGVIPADPATFDSLLDEAERLVRLSRSLDALAEGDAVARAAPTTELDLADAVRSAVELVSPSADRAGLTLRLELPDRVPVRANADHLAQVLSNLLSNAVRYSPAGGEIAVRVEARSADALVSVANPSEPIPADDLERVFERFYRVEKSRDPARGGAGIGLAIVKQLVEAAGGRVGAESSGGRTRIWFTVPA